MRIWIVEDRWHTFPQLAFETKAAADSYIKANQLDAHYHAVAITVYSDREVKELWPE